MQGLMSRLLSRGQAQGNDRACLGPGGEAIMISRSDEMEAGKVMQLTMIWLPFGAMYLLQRAATLLVYQHGNLAPG